MVAPKLRFKEFDGDWATSKLGNLCLRNYQGINTVADKVEYQKTGYPILQAKHITSEKLDFDDVRFLSDLDFDKYRDKYIPKTNDILFSNIGTIGKVVLVGESEPFFIAWNIFLVSVKTDLIVPFYLATYLRRLTSLSYFDNLQTGNATKFINKTDLLDTKVTLPSKEEQTKIASFLSAVDEKINQLTQKHQLLSQYKQGMMQKLFSQQIRFKADDGSEFGEWKKTEIKNISKIFDGTHQTPNYVTAGVPFYSVEHVTANNFKNTKYIAEDVYLAELKRVQLEKGDILLTRIGDIGTCRLIDWDVRASFYVSLALIKVNKQHNSSFVNQYIKSNLFQKELHERTIHVAFPKKINLGEIGLCLIQLPCLEEQTKIANFLSTIDQKMDVVSEQLEQAKLWKKGLLQQMFV